MFSRLSNAWRYLRRPEIEFSSWETPFQNDHIRILGVQYLTGGFDWKDPGGRLGFKSDDCWDMGGADLVVRLCSWPQNEVTSLTSMGKIYTLSFEWVSGFRVLDERGLLELWNATARLGGRPANSTFRIRNHLWSWESPIPFMTTAEEGWSFVIASDDDCVEVIASAEPKITLLETISPYSL